MIGAVNERFFRLRVGYEKQLAEKEEGFGCNRSGIFVFIYQIVTRLSPSWPCRAAGLPSPCYPLDHPAVSHNPQDREGRQERRTRPTSAPSPVSSYGAEGIRPESVLCPNPLDSRAIARWFVLRIVVKNIGVSSGTYFRNLANGLPLFRSSPLLSCMRAISRASLRIRGKSRIAYEKEKATGKGSPIRVNPAAISSGVRWLK